MVCRYDLSVNFHLDDGKYKSAWRNNIKFDPTRKYGGQLSYNQMGLLPLADAVVSAANARTKV